MLYKKRLGAHAIQTTEVQTNVTTCLLTLKPPASKLDKITEVTCSGTNTCRNVLNLGQYRRPGSRNDTSTYKQGPRRIYLPSAGRINPSANQYLSGVEQTKQMERRK